MISDIIRIPIYQGECKAEGTNPLLNNWVYDVVITGESIPKLLPEGSDVDITIKVDRSEKMTFSAYFPAMNHLEELEVDIKQPEPPKSVFEERNCFSKRTAKKVNDSETLSNLEKLENDVENVGVTADGKLQIMDGLRKELLKLEQQEKDVLWPEVEQELKDAFYELEDLIDKIKRNRADGELDMKRSKLT